MKIYHFKYILFNNHVKMSDINMIHLTLLTNELRVHLMIILQNTFNFSDA